MRIRIYSHKETELFERSEFSVSCEYKEFEYADLENYASYSNCLFFIQYINQFGSCPTPTNRSLIFLFNRHVHDLTFSCKLVVCEIFVVGCLFVDKACIGKFHNTICCGLNKLVILT